LFGSRASGEARAKSDVDVGVLFVDDPPRTLDGMAFDLAGAIEARVRLPVDLVVFNRAPVELVHFALRGGRLVYEGDSARRIEFEVRARREYFDLKPILDEYRGGRSVGG